MTGPARLASIIQTHSGPMRLAGKIMIFATLFSAMFFFLHAAEATKTVVRDEMDDLGGIPWLYSAVCLIFSILAGFVIQHEWNQWNNLADAIKGEVSTLRSLWLWSEHVPNLGTQLRESMSQYLTITIQHEWRAGTLCESETAGKALTVVQEKASALYQQPELRIPTVGIVEDLLRHREHRLHSGQRHLPAMLKATVGFADGLVIILSLFIGVKHLWLDYLFTLSIGLLTYVVYLLIDDLDHPLRPGIWHVTAQPYEHLLNQLQRNRQSDRDDVSPPTS
jgi:hypothetical protein